MFRTVKHERCYPLVAGDPQPMQRMRQCRSPRRNFRKRCFLHCP